MEICQGKPQPQARIRDDDDAKSHRDGLKTSITCHEDSMTTSEAAGVYSLYEIAASAVMSSVTDSRLAMTTNVTANT